MFHFLKFFYRQFSNNIKVVITSGATFRVLKSYWPTSSRETKSGEFVIGLWAIYNIIIYEPYDRRVYIFIIFTTKGCSDAMLSYCFSSRQAMYQKVKTFLVIFFLHNLNAIQKKIKNIYYTCHINKYNLIFKILNYRWLNRFYNDVRCLFCVQKY